MRFLSFLSSLYHFGPNSFLKVFEELSFPDPLNIIDYRCLMLPSLTKVIITEI